MSRAKSNVLALSGGALLVISLLGAYGNHFQNSFHFDDAHSIENNASIRALRNIPLFFRDATTFSSLPSNQSYRPLVSTLLAIAYRLGGLKPFWFHFSVFGLFVALTLLLAFVVYRLLEHGENSAQNSGLIALIAAACYGLHPANADTVNYIIASSEVIAALGVIASFAFYFFFRSSAGITFMSFQQQFRSWPNHRPQSSRCCSRFTFCCSAMKRCRKGRAQGKPARIWLRLLLPF